MERSRFDGQDYPDKNLREDKRNIRVGCKTARRLICAGTGRWGHLRMASPKAGTRLPLQRKHPRPATAPPVSEMIHGDYDPAKTSRYTNRCQRRRSQTSRVSVTNRDAE